MRVYNSLLTLSPQPVNLANTHIIFNTFFKSFIVSGAMAPFRTTFCPMRRLFSPGSASVHRMFLVASSPVFPICVEPYTSGHNPYAIVFMWSDAMYANTS